MARKSSSAVVQDELYPLADEVSERRAPAREPFDDARLMDLEAEQESPFLRGQKRVPVRRGTLPKKTANRLLWVGAVLAVLAILGACAAGLYSYGEHSWRFRIDSSDQIEVTGANHVPHAQIMEVMGGDIGRNIFFVPLAQRQQQLEQIPWVESASVMRFVPNRLRIEIHERTPVAFARVGSHISLIDAGGTLMELALGGKRKYSFPVISGMNVGEPLSTRAARMKSYNALVRDLDSGGAHYSQDLSEIDLTDTDDLKVVAADTNGEVLIHLGSEKYLQRYKIYVTHLQQWRQQFDKLESVDLRYEGQIIVNPDLEGMARQPVLTPAAAKAAMAAGVKPAAIVDYEKYVAHAAAAVPPPANPANKDAKLKSKTGARALAHNTARRPASKAPVAKRLAAAKAAAAHKQAPVTKPASAKATSANYSTSPKPAPAKPLPTNQSVTKPGGNSSTASTTKVAAAQNNAVQHPAATSINAQKKPSAAIPKETQQN